MSSFLDREIKRLQYVKERYTNRSNEKKSYEDFLKMSKDEKQEELSENQAKEKNVKKVNFN